MYNGNPDLRKAGEYIDYTPEMLEEIIKCSVDPIYFAEKYFTIIHPDRGKEVIQLFDYQKKMLKVYVDPPDERTFSIICIARQMGKTTLTTIYLLWYALFNRDKTVCVIANKEATAIEILDRIKLAYKGLPLWMQQGIKEGGWNAKRVELDNGTRIIAASTSADSISGLSVSLLFIDEFAKIPKAVAEDFITSTYPVISAGKKSKIIIVSCVTKDTFVFSENGLTKVENFIDDTKPDGFGYEVDEYKVFGKNSLNSGNIIVNSGYVDTNIIKTAFSSLECSEEHKLWGCKDGKYDWYRSNDLREGDYISVRYGMNIYGNDDIVNFESTQSDKFKVGLSVNEINEDWAYFFGLFIAEGYARRVYDKKTGTFKGGQVTITCGDDISEIFNKLGLKYNCYDGIHYTVNSKSLIEFIEFLGFDINKKVKEKTIPERLLRMSKKNIVAMLQGLFDGDGYSRKDLGTVGYSSACKELIMQVKYLLLNEGILTDYKSQVCKPTQKVKVESICYTISMGKKDSLLFYNNISFRLKRKQNKKQFLNIPEKINNGNDIIPYSKQLFTYIRKNKFIKGLCKDRHVGRTNSHILRNYWIKNKERFLNINDPIINDFYEKNISENIIWYKITKIEKSKNKVYDFSLNHTDDFWCHSVIYNGMLGHQTPLGKNLFWEFWSKAIKGKNNFYPIKVKWWEHPERDQQWKKKIIADIGKLRFAQEYECKFLGSNNTLIDSDILEKTDFEEPIDFKWTGLLSIYEKPLQNSMYVLGVDTSKGTGRDYSVVQVLKINHDQSLEQVAVYRNNIIRPRDFAQICISISSYYNNAMMMIENNDVGSIVCEVIWYDYECDRIVNLDPKGLGIRSTKTTKPLANLMLKEYVEEGYLKIVDKSTISELELYEEVSPDVFACDSGNDDCVTSLLWALYFVKTEFYDGPIVSVTGEIEDRYRIKEEECDMPVMILD